MENSFDLKSELSECMDNELAIASDIENSTVKHKLALFMQRKNNKNNFIPKKNSYSNNISISEDIFNDNGYANSSVGKTRIRSSHPVHVLGVKYQKEKFNLFSVSKSSNKLIKLETTKYHDETDKKDYFSFNSKDNINDKEINNEIKNDQLVTYTYLNETNLKISNEISEILKEINEHHNNITMFTLKEKEMLQELKEIRNERNKLISNKTLLSNELDYLMSSPYSNLKKNTVRNNTVNTSGALNKTNFLQNESVIIHTDYNNSIDEMENKISVLKLENSKFFENIDYLNDELVQNEDINKSLKNNLKYLDKTIETLVKEKNAMKNNYIKLFPSTK